MIYYFKLRVIKFYIPPNNFTMLFKSKYACLVLSVFVFDFIYCNQNLILQNVLNEYKNNNFISKQITLASFNVSDVLVISNTTYNGFLQESLPSGTIMIYKNISSDFQYRKLKMIIILLDDLKQMVANVNLFKFVKRLTEIKILIVSFGNKNDILSGIFKLAWEYFLINFDVITVDGIYTYFPFKNQFCNNTNYEPLIFKEVIDYFPQKIPYDLHQCKVRLMAYPIEPYVINVTEPIYGKQIFFLQ